MSDYSFMKSGSSTLIEQPKFSDDELESIEILLSLFASNAMINASNYVKYANRNGITTIDLIYALRYEVFEFFNNPTLNDDIIEMTKEYQEMLEDDDDQVEGLDDIIIPDDEIHPFKRVPNDTIGDANIEGVNIEFIEKMHNYFDSWETWEPTTELEVILKSGIDKIDIIN
uniref:Uncharacterized protein n=1 Tax=viral metagenome TaxID=1070528 RepID=A0A6C0EIF2_9ZZZZ